jgi:hypothetical protein
MLLKMVEHGFPPGRGVVMRIGMGVIEKYDFPSMTEPSYTVS